MATSINSESYSTPSESYSTPSESYSTPSESYSTTPIKPSVNCPYYLPCGYCSTMMRPCINSGGYTITYATGTATTNIQGETNK